MATLLTETRMERKPDKCMGTFADGASEGDDKNIDPVGKKFALQALQIQPKCTKPRRVLPSISTQHTTALRKLAKDSYFNKITPDILAIQVCAMG